MSTGSLADCNHPGTKTELQGDLIEMRCVECGKVILTIMISKGFE